LLYFGLQPLIYDDVLKLENKRLSKLLARYSGRHLIQLSNRSLSSLTVSPILHKILIGNTPQVSISAGNDHWSFLQSAYTDLPFASDSINLVLLPHTLEGNKNAKCVLSEAWRVLLPNSHLIILGINPISLWGFYRLFSLRKKPPWNGYCYSIQTLCQWIHHLGGKICHTESFAFLPPFASTPGKWFSGKLAWLERVSPWLFPYMGGIYLIIAQKQVKQLNHLGLVWHFPPVLSNKALAPNARRIPCG
jgi:SAM-dependent methyltransferase